MSYELRLGERLPHAHANDVASIVRSAASDARGASESKQQTTGDVLLAAAAVERPHLGL